MAPDLNSLSSDPSSSSDSRNAGAKVDYSTPGSTGYNVPDITLNDPQNRRLKVLSIGAGVSGIMMSYMIQKYCENVEFVVYEKNRDLGGTWTENRYPGAACDIPSHAYTFNFALWPDWPYFFSYAKDIQKYLNLVCDTFDLKKYMKFNSKVVGCYWQEDDGQWIVKIEREKEGGGIEEIEERCDLLLYGTGILNNYKWPEIPGLKDKFKGKVVHTADWPSDYYDSAWENDSIAVIGSGASSIQAVPKIQPFAKHIDIFVRTGIWFVNLASNNGENTPYTPSQRSEFRKDTQKLVAHAKDIEDQVNGLWSVFYSGGETQEAAKQMFRERTKEILRGDERLFEGFTPTWGLGCRRITPGDPYLRAIQEGNVDVHFTGVSECTEDGVIGTDGIERKCSTIICATGFDVTYVPRFPMVGRGGVDLRDMWKDEPKGYLGLAAPEMPNMLAFMFPTWPIENGSVMGPLKYVGEYVVQVIQKMQREGIKSLVPKRDVTEKFNEHAQEWVKHTVWKEDCRSWYKNNDTGRVNAVWPGSSLHYATMISSPRYEDFEITYLNKNPWAFMGMGYALEDKDEKKDKSPYLKVENIDKKWLEVVGSMEVEGGE